MSNRGRRNRIFISYRRADSAGHAGRLGDDLTRLLGDCVFMDVSDIAPGAPFERVLQEQLASCGAVLAIIGPRWLEALGAPREGTDYVRVELAQALGHDGVQVVPVLMQGAVLPAAHDLPADLQPLGGRQATVIRDDRWQDDVAHLARELRGTLGLPRPALRWLMAGAAALIAVAVGMALNLPPEPAAYSRSRAHEIAVAATTRAATACARAGFNAGVCPLVFQFVPDGRARNVYFDSGSCPLKAPPFGECVLQKLATVRIPPFDDHAEVELAVSLRVDAGGAVAAVPEPF